MGIRGSYADSVASDSGIGCFGTCHTDRGVSSGGVASLATAPSSQRAAVIAATRPPSPPTEAHRLEGLDGTRRSPAPSTRGATRSTVWTGFVDRPHRRPPARRPAPPTRGAAARPSARVVRTATGPHRRPERLPDHPPGWSGPPPPAPPTRSTTRLAERCRNDRRDAPPGPHGSAPPPTELRRSPRPPRAGVRGTAAVQGPPRGHRSRREGRRVRSAMSRRSAVIGPMWG
jgi:hypothetical protein